MPEAPLSASNAPVIKTAGTLQPDVGRDLLRLEVAEGVEGLRTLALHVVANSSRANPTTDVAEYLDGTIFDYGREIEVSMGPAGNEKVVFKGTDLRHRGRPSSRPTPRT